MPKLEQAREYLKGILTMNIYSIVCKLYEEVITEIQSQQVTLDEVMKEIYGWMDYDQTVKVDHIAKVLSKYFPRQEITDKIQITEKQALEMLDVFCISPKDQIWMLEKLIKAGFILDDKCDCEHFTNDCKTKCTDEEKCDDCKPIEQEKVCITDDTNYRGMVMSSNKIDNPKEREKKCSNCEYELSANCTCDNFKSWKPKEHKTKKIDRLTDVELRTGDNFGFKINELVDAVNEIKK